MKKINILHIGIDSHLGGIETYLNKISTYINKEKFQFNFLSYHGENPCFYDELKELGGTFYFINPRRNGYIKYIKDLNNLFSQNKFDIVHCHLNSLSNIEPSLIALKYGCKVIIHSRNGGCLKSIKSRLLHKINYFRLPKNRFKYLAVSDKAGEWMFKNKKFTVLNNGIDINKFKYSQNFRNEIRAELNIKKKEVFIHVGAFRTQKNHEFIINIFHKYLSLNPNSILLLIGEGELKNKIIKLVEEKNISDNVIFLGNRNDINKLLSAADKFLFPSFYEGFPNALLEAETSGLLCIAADTITKQVVVKDITNLVSLNEPTEKWLEMMKKESIKNRENYAKKIDTLGYGVNAEIKKLEKIYENLLKNK